MAWATSIVFWQIVKPEASVHVWLYWIQNWYFLEEDGWLNSCSTDFFFGNVLFSCVVIQIVFSFITGDDKSLGCP